MKKETKGQSNKIVILTAGIIIATVLIGVILIAIPFVNKNKTLRSEILKERDKNVLIGKIRALGKHLKVYEKRIPEEGRGVSWLLSEVSDMAAREKIEILYIKPGTPEDRGMYVKSYVAMDAVSTYERLAKFISKVESYEKFLRVEQITIKRRDLDKDFSKDTSGFNPFDVKANIVISTVIFKE